jgi:hypothetical protein
MNGLFGNAGGMNTTDPDASPFRAASSGGAAWGTSASLPDRFREITGGMTGVNPQRDMIAQTLARGAATAQPTADVGTAGGVYKDIFQTPGPLTPPTPAASPSGTPGAPPPMQAQQMQTRAAAPIDYGTQGADLSAKFRGMGLGPAMDQPHQLDAMGGGAMPADYKPGPAIAAAGGGAGK